MSEKRFLQDAFSLRDGKALLTVEYVEPLNAEELADLEDWLALVIRKLKRSVKAPAAVEPIRLREDSESQPSQVLSLVPPTKRAQCGTRYDHDALRLRAARYIAEYGPATAYRPHQYDRAQHAEDSPTQPTWIVAMRGHPWFGQGPDGWELTDEGLAAVKGQELPVPPV